MLNIVIIHSKIAVVQSLFAALHSLEPQVNILATPGSVAEGLEYFSVSAKVDLIFSDVQLPDGLSFEIFEKANLTIPVIFITAHDKYIIRSFENNGIDYILSPFSQSDVELALEKYNKLKTHFSNTGMMALSQRLNKTAGKKAKKRLIVKKGVENISVLLEDIVSSIPRT